MKRGTESTCLHTTQRLERCSDATHQEHGVSILSCPYKIVNVAIEDLFRHAHVLRRVVNICAVGMLFVFVLPVLIMPLSLVKCYLRSTNCQSSDCYC